jgi:hypothetical protein
VDRILTRDLPGPATREIRERLERIDCEEFWDQGTASDGLAVFAASGFFAAFRLPGKFPELQVVGGTFHTKPLIRFLQSNSASYHLLALNADHAVLYEGFGDALREVPLRGVPATLEDLLKTEDGAPKSRRDRRSIGQGNAREEAKLDAERFFRALARDLWKNHLLAVGKPLILAAPGHHQPLFRKVAQIPTLLEKGIVADPSKMSLEDLKIEARRVLEPEIGRRIAAAREEFGLARSRGHGSDSLQAIAPAVTEGRVRLLFVESGRRIWGLLDRATGDILPGDPARNAYDVDLLDEVAEVTISRGGEVYVLPKDEMPTVNGIAAIFRF